jgi:hypothetical protein
MERNVVRERLSTDGLIPDFASLHPGYARYAVATRIQRFGDAPSNRRSTSSN